MKTSLRNILLSLLLAAFSFLAIGCAGHDARTFTPTDTAAVGGAVTSTHEQIKKADKQAATIQRTGTASGSKEIAELRVTLRTAEADVLAAQKALDDFKLTDSRKFDDINKEVKTQTARAETAESDARSAKKELQEIKADVQPHLMRLRYAVGAAVILGAMAYGLAPLARASPYLTLVPSIVLSIAAVVAVLVLLAGFLALAGLFGWL